MRWGTRDASRHPHSARLLHMKVRGVWVLLIIAPVLLAAHALGALAFSEVGHGVLFSDQPISLAMGGLLVIAVIAKLSHVAGFGALGAGVFRLRQRTAERKRLRGSGPANTMSKD